MTDTLVLQSCIKKSGLKIGFIANQLGLTYAGFSKKVRGEHEFTASEIHTLRGILGLNDQDVFAIFFADKRECNSTL